MDNTTPRDFYKEDGEPCLLVKSKEQLMFEEERAFTTEKCAHDLEEMSCHLDEDLEELRQSSEHLTGVTNDAADQTDTETDDEESMKPHLDAKSPILVEQFSERRRLLKEREEAKTKDESQTEPSQPDDEGQDQFMAKILDDTTDNVPKRVFGAGCDAPSQDWQQEERLRQLALEEPKDESSVAVNVFRQPITSMTSAEQAEEICQQMDRKLAAEEAELRQMLQDLEDETEAMYDIETTVEFEEVITIGEPAIASICTSLLNDLIDEVTSEEDQKAFKPKSFEFGPIESDDEFSYPRSRSWRSWCRPS